MTSVRSRWKQKLSFSTSSTTSSSNSSSSSSKIIEPIPPEFLCPISSSLMSDPIIVSDDGVSYDRASIDACLDLSFVPPPLSSFLFFIPNPSLKSAILSWAHRSSLPPPLPLDHNTALSIVRNLMANSSSSVSSSEPPVATKVVKDTVEDDMEDPFVAGIVMNLKNPQFSVRENTLIRIRSLARDSDEKRTSICTPALLSAVIPFLLSRAPELQINAVAAIVNLSIERTNRVKIVRSGAVPHLVEVLRSGHPEATDHAAGAVFSLSLEEDNRLAVGALGAVPPLVNLFYQDAAAQRARVEAGMALYNLTLAANNAAKLAKASGATKAVVKIAESEESNDLRRIAVMIMGNVAGKSEGRVALMDAGAVGTLVNILKECAMKEEIHCILVLHKLSKGSLRFRALAKEADAVGALENAALRNGEMGKDMIRWILRVVKGEEDWGGVTAMVLGDDSEEGSVVSDGMVSYRPRYQDIGPGTGSSNSSGF